MEPIRSFFARVLRPFPKARRGAPRPAIEIADLLGRPAINLDTPELQRFLAGKRVMISGAGGSIGSEICRQSMKFCPQRILLLERAENALFEIDRELRHSWVGADIRPYIADLCDMRRIEQIFESERPQVVFHAAAHKHVPLMEHNPCEAIKNNIFGTRIVADAAMNHGAAAFVMVSTDKAVNPSSVMGATKRFAELYVQSLNQECSGPAPVERSAAHPRTRFVAVRFGNVLGSSGSVVPIFQRQIEAGGPVTVTHPDMKRYFMTIPEASQLVMQAGAVAQGGEIFVLDMGHPIRILDLAEELIRRNGLRPNDDIEIRFTGIRPGEKLYEELACDNEQTRPTSHPKIHVWQLAPASRQEVSRGLELLSRAAQRSAADAIDALAACVPEFQPDGRARSSMAAPATLRIHGEAA
ncbi:MAG TPA: nucleoside-diphosphate sugar epimerase/dehydratase [Tepidisphaeraceae bacterium]|nr:nucleoside-diphosphate sugar epimerase/dehydratase [Tepidisphaeraceae bacterium]